MPGRSRSPLESQQITVQGREEAGYWSKRPPGGRTPKPLWDSLADTCLPPPAWAFYQEFYICTVPSEMCLIPWYVSTRCRGWEGGKHTCTESTRQLPFSCVC